MSLIGQCWQLKASYPGDVSGQSARCCLMLLLYYRNSDNIIPMGLVDFLFKNDAQRKLAFLVWSDGLEASVREFALMSGLGYATAYQELHHMEELGLVKKVVQGHSTLYSSSLTKSDQLVINKLRSAHGDNSEERLGFSSRLLELGLPYAGDVRFLGQDPVTDLEELIVRGVKKAKQSGALARALPVVLAKLVLGLDKHRMLYWAKKYDVRKELGFFVELTGLLTKEKRLKALAMSFHDKRWSKEDFFFESEKAAKGFQLQLINENTPAIARRWHLKMNMGLDSFESLFSKFNKGK